MDPLPVRNHTRPPSQNTTDRPSDADTSPEYHPDPASTVAILALPNRLLNPARKVAGPGTDTAQTPPAMSPSLPTTLLSCACLLSFPLLPNPAPKPLTVPQKAYARFRLFHAWAVFGLAVVLASLYGIILLPYFRLRLALQRRKKRPDGSSEEAVEDDERLTINHRVARCFYAVASPLLGWTIDVRGMHHLDAAQAIVRHADGTIASHGPMGKREPVVLMGNHQSIFDLVYLGKIFPSSCAIVAKHSMRRVPVLGQFMRASRSIFIDRANSTAAIASLTAAAAQIHARKSSVFIFPEGTRNNTAACQFLPFKKGAFHLAIQAQIPIVPVVCQNVFNLYDSRTTFSSGSFVVQVLEPIPTTGLGPKDVQILVDRVRSAMLQALQHLSQPSLASPPSESAANQAHSTVASTAPASPLRRRAQTDEEVSDDAVLIHAR